MSQVRKVGKWLGYAVGAVALLLLAQAILVDNSHDELHRREESVTRINSAIKNLVTELVTDCVTDNNDTPQFHCFKSGQAVPMLHADKKWAVAQWVSASRIKVTFQAPDSMMGRQLFLEYAPRKNYSFACIKGPEFSESEYSRHLKFCDALDW